MSLIVRIRRSVTAALASMGFLVITVMFTPLVPWWARKLAGDWNDPSGEVLIVLGGSALEDGILGDSSYWRCVYAVRAFRQVRFTEIVVSGGGPEKTATAMRDFLVAQAVPANQIAVEDRATSTRENALYVKQLLANTPGSKVLLTSDYHMFRARRAFARAGLPVLPRPFPDAIKRSASRAERWPLFFGLCVEMGKSGYYWVRGWI